MSKMIVHMIGNAHLDPAWLWTWPQGLDAALATCRSACDLLDEFPGFIVTRGEAWVHEQVRLLDPSLFARIRKHAASGRWSVVNGWWVQSDCNLPTADSFGKQCSIGRAWFRKHMDVDVTVGYNVDTFGHAATLPMFLRKAGYNSYVFMRPDHNEKTLPADLFEWRAPDGSSVTACRLVSYGCWTVDQLKDAIETCLARADARAGHAMCFYGVGDHGGGPTREQVKWILEHEHFSADAELVFSSPARFFEAVMSSGVALPVVQDELQYHSIGCYTVVHDIKQGMRRAEEICAQAERLSAAFPNDAPAGVEEALEQAWRRILFNQFHDILAGTCIEPAYEHALDELGSAKTTALNIVTHITRKLSLRARPCRNQRLMLVNMGKRDFSGLLHVEPWVYGSRLHDSTSFLRRGGGKVPFQQVYPRCAVDGMKAFLIKARVPALAAREIELRAGEAPAIQSRLKYSSSGLSNGIVSIRAGNTGIASVRLRSREMLAADGIRLASFADDTDTWSHATPSLHGKQTGVFSSRLAWHVLEEGPLRGAIANHLSLGKSSLYWQIFMESDSPILRMRFRINWNDRHKTLKLLLHPRFAVLGREDTVPGGRIRRALDGHEYPFHNASLLAGKGAGIAAVSRDIYGLDVQPGGMMRLTLLRCPPYAHHFPMKLEKNHPFPYTDQGEHVFELSLIPGNSNLSPNEIEGEIFAQTQPVAVVETTDGME